MSKIILGKYKGYKNKVVKLLVKWQDINPRREGSL